MKFIIKALLLSVCLVLSISARAQVIEKSTKIEYIGGKNYYLHTVKSGQTLTAIAMAYSTTVDDILAANPGMKTALKVDQVIKILAKSYEPSRNVTIHIVKQGETLSSIAQQYQVKLEDIFKLNPGISASIKPGQEVKVPKASGASETVAQGAFVTHTVQKSETLFSIARTYGVTVDELKQSNPGLNETIQIGQQIRVPSKGVEVKVPKPVDSIPFECMKTGILPSYNVGLLIPLYLEKASYIDTSDAEKTVKNYSSFAFIGFYEGFMIALDSLKDVGFSVKMMVDDVTEDSNKLKTILNKPSYSDLNLLIGPFYSNVFDEASAWAKEKKVNIVNPFTSRSELVVGNPQVFKNIPSATQQTRQTVEYIRKTWPGCNIILAHCNRETDKEMTDAYLCALKGPDSSFTDFTIVSYNTEGLAGVSKNMVTDKVNVVISFIQGEAATSNYIRNMSELSFRYPMVVFAQADWERYTSLEAEYLLNIHLHILSHSFIDYSKPEVKEFVVKYRTRYHTEPDEYAFAGYDVAMYYLEALHLYGKDFQHCLDQYRPKLLQTSFEFEHQINDGWENTKICIYHFKDYKRVDAFTDPQTLIEINNK